MRPDMNTLLNVNNISRNFGALKALSNVNLTLEDGEILGIAGPNGSGKSTLFNVITGIPFHASDGTVTYDGADITNMRPYLIYRAGLARTFQKDSEFSSLSARDNILVGNYFSNRTSAKYQARQIEDALDLVDFENVRRTRIVDDLSVFDKKRLMVASAIVSKPKILLLDEPASGLTLPEVEQLSDLILAINRTGVAILVIEHVIALLMKVAPRLMIFNEGKVLAEGVAEDIIKNPDVIEAYLGGGGDD